MKTFGKSILSLFGIVFLIFWYAVKPSIQQPANGVHYGANQSQEFFDAAYAGQESVKINDRIAGFTVNHHMLAANLAAKQFSLAATDKKIPVVLISPNHFYTGEGGIISSKYDWKTPYGILESDQAIISQLQQKGLINIDEDPFEQEHGISTIAGFIKRSMPNALVVPIIVKENLPDEKADLFAEELARLLPADSLVIGSIDFSHYLVSNAAKFHDAQTISAINNFDFERIPKLDVDSHSGLRLLLKYFDLTGNKKFVLTSHENSSTVTGNYTFGETTSYINGYFTKGQPIKDQTKTVLYFQGLEKYQEIRHTNPLSPDYAYKKSERLFKYNDESSSPLPSYLSSFNLGSPLAVGLVYSPDVTDVYLFPLQIVEDQVELKPQPKPDTMHMQIK